MPPAEWTPSSVRPMGKSPRVRVCYSSRHKTGERDVLILFLNPASARPDSEASGSITGHGSGCRGNRPPPAHCRLPRPWAGTLLPCTLWSPVCWKTRSESNTLRWHRTLGSKCLHAFEILFPQKLEDSWNIQSVGAILKSTGFGLRLTWENSSPATYLLKDLWQFIPTTYSWVSLSMNEPHLTAEKIIQRNDMKTQGQRSTHPAPRRPHTQGSKKKKKKTLRV